MSFKIESVGIVFMLNKFINRIESDFNGFKDKHLFLAISGGKDSMTLAHLLLKLELSFTMLHCNFKLRIPEADQDEVFLKNFAFQHNLPFRVKHFNTSQEAQKQNATIQETARNLRYDWFKTFLNNPEDLILTAHHQDDNIETFFINLLRGTSLRGLSGMPYFENQIARPLLSFTQVEINDFVVKNNISFCQDHTNFETKYLRNKLRINVLPTLKELTPKADTKFSKTILAISESNQWIIEQARKFQEQNFTQDQNITKIQLKILKQQDSIFLEYILHDYGIHRSNRNEFISFLKSQSGKKFHTTNWTFIINRSEVLIIHKVVNNSTPDPTITINQIPTKIQINNLEISLDLSDKLEIIKSNLAYSIDASRITFPLTLRSWKLGDRIQPLGMSGTKLISDILIDKKLALTEKQQVIIIEDTNGIITALGIVISDNYKITKTTTSALTIQWSN